MTDLASAARTALRVSSLNDAKSSGNRGEMNAVRFVSSTDATSEG
jgi:hypothetical protein